MWQSMCAITAAISRANINILHEIDQYTSMQPNTNILWQTPSVVFDITQQRTLSSIFQYKVSKKVELLWVTT